MTIELKNELLKSSALLDLFPTAACYCDGEGRILSYNSRAAEIWGCLPNKNERTSCRAVNETLETTRPVFEIEEDVVRPDASTIPVSCSAVPVRSENGNVVGVISTFHDISQLKQTDKDLQAAIRIREDFMSMASHELRTPLTAIKMQVEMLRKLAERYGSGAIGDQRMWKLLSIADRQIKNLDNLLNDLLDTTHIANGKFSVQPGPTDLSQITRDVVESLEDQFVAAGCRTIVDIDGPIVGFWDGHRMEQVLINLLSNAMKYACKKPVYVSLKRIDSCSVRLIVRDEGQGIPKDCLGKIFERFERIVTGRSEVGLGLGLFIVRQIVEMHGGKIWANSDEGKGSEFIIDLPTHQAVPHESNVRILRQA